MIENCRQFRTFFLQSTRVGLLWTNLLYWQLYYKGTFRMSLAFRNIPLSAIAFAAAMSFALVACGDDSSSASNDDTPVSSSEEGEILSSSSESQSVLEDEKDFCGGECPNPEVGDVCTCRREEGVGKWRHPYTKCYRYIDEGWSYVGTIQYVPRGVPREISCEDFVTILDMAPDKECSLGKEGDTDSLLYREWTLYYKCAEGKWTLTDSINYYCNKEKAIDKAIDGEKCLLVRDGKNRYYRKKLNLSYWVEVDIVSYYCEDVDSDTCSFKNDSATDDTILSSSSNAGEEKPEEGKECPAESEGVYASVLDTLAVYDDGNAMVWDKYYHCEAGKWVETECRDPQEACTADNEGEMKNVVCSQQPDNPKAAKEEWDFVCKDKKWEKMSAEESRVARINAQCTKDDTKIGDVCSIISGGNVAFGIMPNLLTCYVYTEEGWVSKASGSVSSTCEELLNAPADSTAAED